MKSDDIVESLVEHSETLKSKKLKAATKREDQIQKDLLKLKQACRELECILKKEE